jgi:hypothetical protein
MPKLALLNAHDAGLTIDRVPPSGYGGGLSGGALTHFILRNLNSSNPQLQTLDLSLSTLDFSSDVANSAVDNFPHIRSSGLQVLSLSNLQQLRTGPSGPADSLWLADLPSLQQFNMLQVPDVTIPLAAFRSALHLTQILITGTPAIGSLNSLCRSHRITNIAMDWTGLSSTLPTNISSCWPLLRTISIQDGNLFGSLPSFAGLPNLTSITLNSNALSGGGFPDDFAQGSTQLVNIDLSEK